MTTKFLVTVAVLAGIGIGAITVETLHAQSKPPVYVVSEIDESNVDAYTKQYISLARSSIAKAGGKAIAAGQKVTMIEGTPQAARITINSFESLEKVQAWRNSHDYQDARKTGDKYAKFRTYVVDGLP